MKQLTPKLKLAWLLPLLAAVLGLSPTPAQAAGTTLVSVSLPTQSISPSQAFDISIKVQPGESITGVQLNLSFDPKLVQVSKISEGDLFKQGGASSYFAQGTTDNAKGTIKGLCSVILGVGKNVSAPGTLATVSLTAGPSSGNCTFSLTNVIVGNLSGSAAPNNAGSTQLTIGVAAAPQPPSGGGGGGGGGFISSGPPAATASNSGGASLKLDSTGTFQNDYQTSSDDQQVKLSVAQGTQSKTQSGNVLDGITISRASTAPLGAGPAPSAGSISPIYSFGPEGATFSPSIELSIGYDPSSLPTGTDEARLIIGYWNPSSRVWEEVNSSRVDFFRHLVSVKIGHFSYYGVMVKPARPADIALKGFEISGSDAVAGQTFHVAAAAANSGELAGSYTLTLSLDSEVLEVKTLEVAGASQNTCEFTLTIPTAGTHLIDINGLTREFQVMEPTSTPAAQPPLASAVPAVEIPAPRALEANAPLVAPPQSTDFALTPNEQLQPASLPASSASTKGSATPMLPVALGSALFSMLATLTFRLWRGKHQRLESRLSVWLN